jgi:phosphatidate cytidylyltransferase
MLKQRIITALVLLAILLPALFANSPEPFCAVTLVLMAAGAWEWGRMNGYGPKSSLMIGMDCVVLCALSWKFGWLTKSLPVFWSMVGAAWVLGAAALLRSGVPGWAKLPKAVRVIGGVLALWAAWLAVAQARVIGINFLLSILLLVWMADIAAYFAGRAFGMRIAKVKLAPSISPGKSWEGVWGGLLGVFFLALIWTYFDAQSQATVPSLYTRVVSQSWLLLPVVVLFMGAMSVAGDLVESLIKRSVGVKDSSGLLPGHGGVLDRVDALLPTLPLAMMLKTLLS